MSCRHTLRFPAPSTHYVEVETVVPAAGRQALGLFMAVWTPGSYLVREYAGQVESVTARAGERDLPVTKTRKNGWRIATAGHPEVSLRYRVYGFVPSVRHNWVEAGFAMLNGAPTFLSLVEPGTRRPHEVTLELPDGWTGVWTPMSRVEGKAWTFRAEDYDSLVDSPILAGSPAAHEFAVDGKHHALVLGGDTKFFDARRAVSDVQQIVLSARRLMGSLPYPHYHFLTMLGEKSDGLEHTNAFLVMGSRFTTRTRRGYLGWLSLVALTLGPGDTQFWQLEILPLATDDQRAHLAAWIGE